jgi:riboflavin biosynthesis pyrimidine reductase
MDRPFVFINVATTADGKIVHALAANDLDTWIGWKRIPNCDDGW